MLSKEMYSLLSSVPRHEDPIAYEALNPSDDETLYRLIGEAAYDGCGFINKHGGTTFKRSTFSLTEKGQALVEEYEAAERNQQVVEESLKIAQKSLQVAQVAKWAAIFSAIAAVAPQIPKILNFFEALFDLLAVQ